MSHFAFVAIFMSLILISSGQSLDRIGINYGKLGNNLLSPYQSIEIIKSMQVGMVKLYDADPETLKLLAGTDLHASITVPNDEIAIIASNETLANQWVHDNVFAYYPQTMIRYIMVGNEVYSYNDSNLWNNLPQAMNNIRENLREHDIHNIKIGTPLGMDTLDVTFPPSNGSFRVDTLTTIVPILQFLQKTNSFFFLDVYPYFSWAADLEEVSLNFTLFKGGNLTYTDPGSGLRYTNILDQMLDSVYFAMTKLGFPKIPIAIAETGWPNEGDIDQPGANVYNAATYNRNLVKKVLADPPLGTPARPCTIIPTFVFSFYDENLNDGPGTERHRGLLKPDGTSIYPIDFTRTQIEFDQLPDPTNNKPYKGKLWCVALSSANLTNVGPTLSEMCSHLDGACDTVIGAGKDCYEPVSMFWHASYVFSAYCAKFRYEGTLLLFQWTGYSNNIQSKYARWYLSISRCNHLKKPKFEDPRKTNYSLCNRCFFIQF